MNRIALEIEKYLHEIVLSSENQLEILVGSCQSTVKLTNTQEHILMLIEKAAYTNTEIAKELNVSQAAITKATKSLVAQGLLVAVRDDKDARIVRFSLTEAAKPIAAEHLIITRIPWKLMKSFWKIIVSKSRSQLLDS